MAPRAKKAEPEEIIEVEEEVEIEEPEVKHTIADFRQSLIEAGVTFADGITQRDRFMNDAEVKQVDALCKLYDSIKG